MMRIIAAVLVLAGLYPHANGQENPPATQAVAASVGLEIGQPAPAFALSDQFGHENSSEALKRPKGTVLLFFRSADW